MFQYVFRQYGEQPKVTVTGVRYHDQTCADIEIFWSVLSENGQQFFLGFFFFCKNGRYLSKLLKKPEKSLET